MKKESIKIKWAVQLTSVPTPNLPKTYSQIKLKGGQKMINKKKLAMFILPILALTLVSALTYYAWFSLNVSVNQPIAVSPTGALTQSVSCEAGHTCLGQAITVSNSDDEARTVKIVNTYGNGNIAVSYVGVLELTKKNTATWQPVDPANTIEITYTVVGNNFEYSGNIPEGYVLVYAKDHQDRFNDPAEYILADGIVSNIAQSDDWNLVASPNYCDSSNGFDDYEHCIGAKLWLVKSEDLNNGELTWQHMNDYYYETDLVYYFANTNNEITVPAGSFITFYPTFTPDHYIGGGEYNFVFEVQ